MDVIDHLDPLEATRAIRAAYERYLQTTMRTNDPGINEAIRTAFNRLKRPLAVGPIIESAPRYRTGATVAQLVEEGALSPLWLERDLGGQVIPHRPLYLHQEQAVRRAVVDRRNLVVATGTGSGKTETFLIPIVEELFRQRQAGVLGPGVRALLLYPMNALANDQLKRLRLLLAHWPEITFGRYTGDTPDTRTRGVDALRAAHTDAPVLDNELLGREEMQASPPHILLTNYAMLEYLLLRPDDSPLFDPSGEYGWRFIVLDEVHTYDGAMGLEIGMLLRRLRDRVNRSAGNIQAIGTSATAGGPDDQEQVARFAQDLFDLPFEWVADDPARQDVIVATTEDPELPARGPDVDLRAAMAMPDEEAAATLLSDGRVQNLLRDLSRDPLEIGQIAARISDPPDEQLAADLVRRLSGLKSPGSDTPILRARFHTFVRAPEGVDLCLRVHEDGKPRAFLESVRYCPDCGEDAPVAELAVCRRCSQWHLRGVLARHARRLDDDLPERSPSHGGLHGSDSDVDRLLRAVDREDSDQSVLLLAPAPEDAPNEDAAEDDETSARYPIRTASERQVERICFSCLSFSDGGTCTCPTPRIERVALASRTQSGALRCVNCNAPATQGGPRRLRLGSDAPAAVVASALFDVLPRSSGRPRLLSFADSRQDAAFFAPYLERTYGRIARRRLMLDALREGWRQTDGQGVRPEEVARLLLGRAERQGVFRDTTGALERKALMRAWVLAELSAIDSRQSLAGVGLAARRLVRPKDWQPPRKLLEAPWSLNRDEAWLVIEALLKTLLDTGAFKFPDDVGPDDELFSPRNKVVGFRRSQSATSRSLEIQGWVPAGSSTNGRLDYLGRLLSRLQPTWSLEQRRDAACEALEGLWRVITDGNGPLRGYAVSSNDRTAGVYYQLEPNLWKFTPPGALLRCSVCAAIEHAGVRGVCPSFRCPGTLLPVDGTLMLDHYRLQYEARSAGLLFAEEHTAQWTAAAAAKIQDEFVSSAGTINVLSCSTTFELGVDLGELEAVFLRNVPPSPANYVQRAGRAGRRASNVGFVVTFAQLRPHDTQAFDRANELVAGRVPAPRIPPRNTHVVRRHVHSVAISRFLRQLSLRAQWPKTTGEFFQPESGLSPSEQFRRYLGTRDEALQGELMRIVPSELHEEIGLDTWTWAELLARRTPEDSPLARAEAEVRSDIELYKQLRDDASEHHDYTAANRYQRVLNTVQTAYLLGYLASRNVIPKYGFPVDVVPLRTSHLATEQATSVELERDLRVAISEYAPGAGVVAAKRLWISAGLNLLPRRGLMRKGYGLCRACHRFYVAEDLAACPQCKAQIESGELVQPLFGFVSGPPERRPLGEDRPPRLYATRVLFHEIGDIAPLETLIAGIHGPVVEGRFSRQGSLAVVNSARRQHFRICHECGFARNGGERVGKHNNPVTEKRCAGTLERADLGHVFVTDIAEFRLPGIFSFGRPGRPHPLIHTDEAMRASVLAALLEGARRVLQVRHDDLAGVAYVDHGTPVFALYDDVPGGAGLAREAHRRVRDVVEAARHVCDDCKCGTNSSCYGCLRTYRNQDVHEILDRTFAGEVLGEVLKAAAAVR